MIDPSQDAVTACHVAGELNHFGRQIVRVNVYECRITHAGAGNILGHTDPQRSVADAFCSSAVTDCLYWKGGATRWFGGSKLFKFNTSTRAPCMSVIFSRFLPIDSILPVPTWVMLTTELLPALSGNTGSEGNQ